jgi:uncharacterized membrane protein YadS
LGLSAHDTSQVVGSALTYEGVYGKDTVLKTAIVTKLTRNLSLAAVIPIMVLKHASESTKLTFLQQIQKHTPHFVYGFLLLSLLRTGGDLFFATDSSLTPFLPEAVNDLWRQYGGGAEAPKWSHVHKNFAELGVVGLGFAMVI